MVYARVYAAMKLLLRQQTLKMAVSSLQMEPDKRNILQQLAQLEIKYDL